MPVAGDGADLFQRVEVTLRPGAKEEGRRARLAGGDRLVQDGQKRRQSAAASDQQQRCSRRAQPEVAQRSVDLYRLADDALLVDQRRENAARHLAHKEADLRVRLHRCGEGVTAADAGQRCDADAGELAGLVGQGFIELHAQARDVAGEPVLPDHTAGHGTLWLLPRQFDFDAHIRLRHALACQDVALIEFVVGQEVAAIGQLLDLALDQPALAGRATADPATVGEIDTLAQGRLQQRFLRIDRDRLRVDVRSDDAWRGRCLLGKERKHVCSVEANGQTGSLIMVCGMRRGKEVGD